MQHTAQLYYVSQVIMCKHLYEYFSFFVWFVTRSSNRGLNDSILASRSVTLQTTNCSHVPRQHAGICEGESHHLVTQSFLQIATKDIKGVIRSLKMEKKNSREQLYAKKYNYNFWTVCYFINERITRLKHKIC